jgi:hypothetical protein
MSNISEEQYEALEKQIEDSLRKACAHKDRLKRSNSRYGIANIIMGALATFVAGQSVILGPVLGNWKLACTVAGIFALGATIGAGIQKQLADSDLLAEASECCGRLRTLKVETIARDYELERIKSEYKQVLTGCPRVET